MPNLTPNLGLKKPLSTETADITVINDNMDTIDASALKKTGDTMTGTLHVPTLEVGNNGTAKSLTDGSASFEAQNGIGFFFGKSAAHLGGNVYYDGANYQRYDITKPSALLEVRPDMGSIAALFAQAGANPLSFGSSVALAQVLSGGYKIQSGTGTYNCVSGNNIITVNLPVSQTGYGVFPTLNGYASQLSGVSISTQGAGPGGWSQGFTLVIYSPVAQNINFGWIVIGS